VTRDSGDDDSVLRGIAAAPATPPPSSAALRPGVMLAGRYRLERELGRGAMGRVFAARDLKLARDVAIKLLLGEATDPRLERFEQEARAAGSINHANIVTVFDVAPSEHGPFIVSERLEGETLRDRLARGPLAAGDVAAMGAQLAEGLNAAHEHGVVHRDLKPANLFVTQQGRLKILDFGVAKLLEPGESAPRTEDGAIIGTVEYMSPEQVRGEAVDARCDLFSAGVVLYEMLTGRRPFVGSSRHAIERHILERDPEPLPDDVAPALAAIVGRCLQKRPDQRFKSARQLADAFSDATWLGDRRAPRHVASAPRARLVRIAALLGALACVAVGGIVVRDRRVSPHVNGTPSVAILPFRDLSPAKDQGFLSDGVAEEILTLLARVDGLRVAGRTSSFSFRDTNADARTIGQKLGVGALLEGSVRRDGEHLRISARLVNADDGYQLWAQDFDRKSDDLISVEDELARDIVGALKVKLVAGSHTLTENHGSRNPEAYTAYLRARLQYQDSAPNALAEARRSIERVIALDPQFAEAWAEYAEILRHSAFEPAVTRAAMSDLFARARKAVAEALRLDPNLANAYVVRAGLRHGADQWDIAGARADLEQALALDPNNASAIRGEAVILMLFPRRVNEMIALMQRAAELDPLEVRNWSVLSQGYRTARRFDDERVALAREAAIAPQEVEIPYALGELEYHLGHLDKALAIYDSMPPERRDFVLGGRAAVLKAMHRTAESRAALAELEAKVGKDSPTFVGMGLAEAGDLDRAFYYFDYAVEMHDPTLRRMISSPWLANVHHDPRYRVILGKLGLLDDGASEGQ
jgi:eukaryotic-like serine/threonine-protein kinase